MNREDIIRLVRQVANEEMEIAVLSVSELEKYTGLVEAAEREAILRLADSLGWVNVDHIKERGQA